MGTGIQGSVLETKQADVPTEHGALSCFVGNRKAPAAKGMICW